MKQRDRTLMISCPMCGDAWGTTKTRHLREIEEVLGRRWPIDKIPAVCKKCGHLFVTDRFRNEGNSKRASPTQIAGNEQRSRTMKARHDRYREMLRAASKTYPEVKVEGFSLRGAQHGWLRRVRAGLVKLRPGARIPKHLDCDFWGAERPTPEEMKEIFDFSAAGREWAKRLYGVDFGSEVPSSTASSAPRQLSWDEYLRETFGDEAADSRPSARRV